MAASAPVVLMSGTLGDTALAVPMLYALGKRHPTPPMVVARPDFLPVLSYSRFPLQTVAYDRPPWNTLFLENAADVAGEVRTALAEAPQIINLLDTANSTVHRHLKEWGQERLTDIPAKPPHHWRESVAAYWLSAARLPAGDLKSNLLEVPLARKMQARSDMQHHVRRAGRPIVLLHPGSGGLSKCWATEHFEALADRAAGVLLDPLFLVGPDELERFGQRLLFALQAHAPVLGPMPLEDAIAHVAASDVYVGNDAGLTHVAGLLGTRTVALFGPTSPALWRPCGARVRVIHKPHMADITVDDVLAAVEQAMEA